MPQISSVKRKQFQQFLSYIGCSLKRTKGDHLIYDRSGLKRPVVITTDREVPAFIIRSNLRTLSMTTEQFLLILKQLKS